MLLSKTFFTQDALVVAPKLLGKTLIRKYDDGSIFKDIITDLEVYKGEEDLASHARFTSQRIGVDYAGDWAQKPWRFFVRI